MASYSHRFPFVLIAVGLLLVACGMFAAMSASPVAALDCGCGGQVQCVTKQWIVNLGWVMSISGIVLACVATNRWMLVCWSHRA